MGRKSPRQLHGNAKLEVLWTVIPALILAAIAVPTVSAVFELTGCDDDSMRVEVIGHQWWFEFHYPDHGIDTANILVMPVDEARSVCRDDVRRRASQLLGPFHPRQEVSGAGADPPAPEDGSRPEPR
jgi:hypothetical protein